MRETNRGFLNYAFKGRGEKIPMRIFLNLELSTLSTMCITRACYDYFQICDIFLLTALDPRFKSLKVVVNKEAMPGSKLLEKVAAKNTIFKIV